MKHHKVIIIGGGPTGLGAAYRLKELGEHDFCLLEAREATGGLATSYVDDKGFWWDIGGHVQFSHYKYFDRLMDSLLPKQWLSHQRESWVWIADRFVPYPFQLNIHRLPKVLMMECLDGLINLYKQPFPKFTSNFEEWILQTAGEGIAKYFLIPYNFKVWAYPPKEMNVSWVGERVAITDLSRVIHNVLENRDDLSWGPNNTFRFPKHGGTGAIWKNLSESIGEEYIRCNMKVKKVDTVKKIITCESGETFGYDYLINTMPLDKFVMITDLDDKDKKITSGLKHSTTHIVGVGLKGKPSAALETKCWMYFPESNAPFYRVTLFSKYSPENVPDSSTQFSLMTEVASSPVKKVNTKKLIEEVVDGLYATKLISKNDKVIDTWYHEEAYGYPTPSVERDEILKHIQPMLMKRNILSRGRFGMWKYEVSNQDHSLMQGVEAASYIINGDRETTAWYPDLVNGKQPYDGAA